MDMGEDRGRARPTELLDIDDVIDELGRIVDRARRSESRLGYFPALYRRVTLEVRDWIHRDRFDDGARVEQLDVLFARRYVEAYHRWQSGDLPTHSWQIAFRSARSWWPIVLQHLLLGINAHINLDLGIAAARTASEDGLDALQRDFFRVTDLLASMVDEVQEQLVEIWPLLALLDRLGGRSDEATIHFSIERARNEAWAFARRLSSIGPGEWSSEIQRADADVAALGRRIRHPGPLLGSTARVIRLGELRSVPEVIDLLS